jgi:hypothetical protein
MYLTLLYWEIHCANPSNVKNERNRPRMILKPISLPKNVPRLKKNIFSWPRKLVTTGSRFVLKTVLDLVKCRTFRVNQRSNRVTFRMHVLLLNTTATNLKVSVEPEREFSFMNATKTVSRNSLIENTAPTAV